MLEVIREAIRQKGELIDRMAKQLEPEIESGSIPDHVFQCFGRAKMNLDSVNSAIKLNKPSDVVHFYGRLCVSLGEFKGWRDSIKTK